MEHTPNVLELIKDYKVHVDSVDLKLQNLKREIIAIRKQDLLLLKHFIEINEVIQNLRQKTKVGKPCDISSPDSGVVDGNSDTCGDDVTCTKMTLPFEERRRLPLVRQQSVPYYIHVFKSVDSSSKASSFDDISEFSVDEDWQQQSDNDSLFSLSLSGNFPVISKNFMKPRSLSYEEQDCGKFEDDYLEELLATNIQLWKKSENKQSDVQKVIFG